MEERSLDDIMSGRDEPAPTEQTAPEPISDAERAANPIGAAERERDQAGRFAKAGKDEPKPEAIVEPEGDKPEGEQPRQPGNVPKQALEAERRKRQERDDQIAQLLQQNAELMRQMAQRATQPTQQAQTEQAAPPEFWSDPNAATDYRLKNALDPVNQQVESLKLAYSQRFAVQEHGAEAVQSAVQALGSLRQTNPAEYQRLETLAGRSIDPVGDVVRWHKQQRVLTEIGSDPDAYKAKLRAELLAEMQAQNSTLEADDPEEAPQPAARGPQDHPQQRMPNSFAEARNAGPRANTAIGGPRPLSEIMGGR